MQTSHAGRHACGYARTDAPRHGWVYRRSDGVSGVRLWTYMAISSVGFCIRLLASQIDS